MQGYFTFEFRGAKAQTYELIDYLTSRKEEDDLHGFLFYCMRKAWDYDEKGDNEETSVEVSMSNVGGSGNIRGLDIESIVNELCSAVPALSMNGYFELLDANSRQNFTSIAGSDSYEEEYVDDMRCLYCQQSIDPESPDVYVDGLPPTTIYKFVSCVIVLFPLEYPPSPPLPVYVVFPPCAPYTSNSYVTPLNTAKLRTEPLLPFVPLYAYSRTSLCATELLTVEHVVTSELLVTHFL